MAQITVTTNNRDPFPLAAYSTIARVHTFRRHPLSLSKFGICEFYLFFFNTGTIFVSFYRSAGRLSNLPMSATVFLDQHEDAVAVCGSIVAACNFFLTSPLMCRTVAAGPCLALMGPLRAQRAYRRQLAKSQSSLSSVGGTADGDGKEEGASGPSSPASRCGAEQQPFPTEAAVVYQRIDKTHDDELVVRVFHAGFMVFAACLRWPPPPPSSSSSSSSSPAPLPSFVECCGGVVKLDRADLLALCLEAVCDSLMPAVAQCSDDGHSIGAAMGGDDASALRDFFAAVVERHPQSPASVAAARLAVLLGDVRLFPTAEGEADASDEEGSGRSPMPSQAFVGAYIQLIAGGGPSVRGAVRFIADRIISTRQWYGTDVDVLLEGLRMGAGREADAPLLERAVRVVLRDSLPLSPPTPPPSAEADVDANGDEGAAEHTSAEDGGHVLGVWLRRMALSEDYYDSFVAKGVTPERLVARREGMGRLDILDGLGVSDMDDVDAIYRVLAEV